MSQTFKVPVTELTRDCSKDPFHFTSTADLESLDQVIGQQRAIEAIDFGLNMMSPGYHIFISGPEGTGKTTIIGDILKRHASDRETPPDLCMVNRFDDPSSPRILEMPTGSALFFARRMTQFLETLKAKLPKAFEAPEFLEKQGAAQAAVHRKNQEIYTRVEEEAQSRSVGILKTEEGVEPVPMADGKPLSPEDFQALTPDKRAGIEADLEEIRQLMELAVKESRAQAREMREEMRKLAADLAGTLLLHETDQIFSDFMDHPPVKAFLEEMQKDMKENLSLLLQATGEEGEEMAMDPAAILENRYEVNVLLDRRGEQGAPVIVELNPTFQNLFGKIERLPSGDGVVTDFTMVQAGSLLRAHKGYLVLEVESLLRSHVVWETLKNTLQTGKLVIQDVPDQPGFFSTTLTPEPIDVDLKVILLGGYEIFRLLQGEDPKFNKIFRVRADFDHEAWLTPQTLALYARFISRVCRTQALRHVTPCGVTALVEYGSRIAEDKRKLSLRFGQVLSLIKEADYWAGRQKAGLIDQTHVAKALAQYRFRHNLYEEKVQEGFDDASILLDVAGRVTGQVNALAVYQIGEIAFGRPSRITAESYMGKPGIINVEHEADLSGQTHDKGVMIVAGYLGRMFAQNYPLSVSISITFEQSYSGIDGDSASSTELYAVLSSLSGCPISQGIAVTGSVNQKGQIQAIGGVNEKIEGFYDVCVKKGLTRDQGVMIPRANTTNLMLRKDVVAAVEKGEFSIFQIETIEQGIEILTGLAAGVPDGDGNFPPETLFGRVQARLKHFHDKSVAFSR